jgi:hypothetical protein
MKMKYSNTENGKMVSALCAIYIPELPIIPFFTPWLDRDTKEENDKAEGDRLSCLAASMIEHERLERDFGKQFADNRITVACPYNQEELFGNTVLA